ncbi:DUF397 domain-containing protein [Streptomyces sp. NPDC045251]|uniref:DUF397 domain-containing protein n=1 Tax=unclassified Streptomyces TaxID=2593676 RepID=UPI0033CCF711
MKNTPDLSVVTWRKSSYSDGGDNNCVEVGDGCRALVPVRDSKVRDGRVLVFGAAPWNAFVAGVKGGA